MYTDERNVQMLISLMKIHGVRKVVVSPGATNITFVVSIQNDPFFELFSSADERSAAYIACGLAAQSGEAVALSCTGATASRNYLPGLTEAYYRKLPILAITSTQFTGKVGHDIPQVIDRSVVPNDAVKMSVQIDTVRSLSDEWVVTGLLNKALLELTHNGFGPVHINLTTTYSENFTVKEILPVRAIYRVCDTKDFPRIRVPKLAIFVGSHRIWSEELLDLVDSFCEKYNGVVICDHTSNYKGKYGIRNTLLLSQDSYIPSCVEIPLMIHMGDVSGAYISVRAKEVWRVSEDGQLKDPFGTLTHIFEMQEIEFFEKYLQEEFSSVSADELFYAEWQEESVYVGGLIPELPFSNIWIAQQTACALPEKSVLHLGILNTLRAWNFFDLPNGVLCFSNTGGFGIDGCVSSLVGASLADKEKLCFGIVGDLAFFYDMNSLANRHIGKNFRLMVVNNGEGAEFKNYNHKAMRTGLNKSVEQYVSAYGHYGNKSKTLLKHYAEDLGFQYLSAKNKEEYLKNMSVFLHEEKTEKPIVFEVFTDSSEESTALQIIRNLR